jgi:hypothetical protein
LLLKFGLKGHVDTDSQLICSLFSPKCGTKTDQPNKIQKRANPDDEKNDQSRKIFSLRPYHPEFTQSHLVSKAKQCQVYLVLEQIFRGDFSETSSLETRGGMPSKFK